MMEQRKAATSQTATGSNNNYKPADQCSRVSRRALRFLALVPALIGLASCGDDSSPLSISTTSLPNGQVGKQYSVQLTATGGTGPRAWRIDAGALPPGLTLSPAGLISGIPAATVEDSRITFQATETVKYAQHAAFVTLPLNVSPAEITIALAPIVVGITSAQTSSVAVATDDIAGVNWNVSPGGPALSQSSTRAKSGTITFDPAGAAGIFTVTATSITDPTQSASMEIRVSPDPIEVSLTSSNRVITTGRTASLSFSTNDLQGVSWSVSPDGALITPNPSDDPASGMATLDPGGMTGTLTVTATSITDPSKSASISVQVDPVQVSISPKASGITVAQTASLSFNTNDTQGIRWIVTPGGAAITPDQSAGTTSGTATFSSGGAAGTYTVTAISTSDPSKSASAQIGVTDLKGVFTYRNTNARDGANTKEYALTPATVSSGIFGKLFSCPVDGAIFAQPLWVADVEIASHKHNVVYVATAHDGLFAFDADTSPCNKLWSVNLIDADHGGVSGEVPVPSKTSDPYLPSGPSISPETGIYGTPVIDPAKGILYVVTKSILPNPTWATFYQKLHAIDIHTGAELPGSPVLISGSYPRLSDGTVIEFDPYLQNQRAGLALINGVVYICWASHGDWAIYYGWVMGYRYNGSGFTQDSVLNVSPNRQFGGIWMGGGAPATDDAGNIYVMTGNGPPPSYATASQPPLGEDFEQAMLKIAPTHGNDPAKNLAVAQYFRPSGYLDLNSTDWDFASGGPAVLMDITAGTPPRVTHLVTGGGKDGNLYILDRDNLGGLGDEHAWQRIPLGNGIYSTPTFWNETLYVAPFRRSPRAYSIDPSHPENRFALRAAAPTPDSTKGNMTSTSAFISAQGNSDGVLWALGYQAPSAGILFAYDATSLQQIWSGLDAPNGPEIGGNVVQFGTLVVANGKVYVGTRGDSQGTEGDSPSTPGLLDVYGLKSN